MMELECYVGVKSCGCLVAITMRDLEDTDLRSILEEWTKYGYKIKLMRLSDAKKKLKFCKCQTELKTFTSRTKSKGVKNG